MKSLFRVAILSYIVVMLVLSAGAALADFKESDWRFYRKISAPDPGPEGFVAVPVDARVYAHSRKGLEDLRVIGPDGEEVPYVIIIPRGKVQRTVYRPEILNRALKEGERRDSDAPYVVIIPRDGKGRVIGDAAVVDRPAAAGSWQEFVVDFGGPGHQNNRLELVVPDRNFRRSVRIYGSDDAADWRLIRDGINIFDYSGDVHVRELTLDYPQNIFRYLKVEISIKEDEQPITVSGVEIAYTEIEPPVETDYPPVDISINANPKLKSTDILVDLGGKNIPIKRLALEVGDPEFYRKVQVLDQKFKSVKREGTIYRYAADGLTHERLTIETGGIALGKFGIRIFNHDNRPLAVEGIKAVGVVRAVVFRPPKQGAARLFLENPRAEKPVYDLAAVYPKVSRDLPPMGKLRAEAANPLFVPFEPTPEPTPPKDYTWMIWPVLLIAVAVMAWLLMRNVGQMKDEGE